MTGVQQIASASSGRLTLILLLAVTAMLWSVSNARADQKGVSFWLPGLFGGLVASADATAPVGFTTMYYHSSVAAGGRKRFVLGGGVIGGLNT